MGDRPLGCNYPYECADGEWTGPVWGSDSDQGDDCVREWRQTHSQTVGAWKRGRQDAYIPGMKKRKKGSHTLDQGQRLSANTQDAGNWTVLTSGGRRKAPLFK